MHADHTFLPEQGSPCAFSTSRSSALHIVSKSAASGRGADVGDEASASSSMKMERDRFGMMYASLRASRDGSSGAETL